MHIFRVFVDFGKDVIVAVVFVVGVMGVVVLAFIRSFVRLYFYLFFHVAFIHSMRSYER